MTVMPILYYCCQKRGHAHNNKKIGIVSAIQSRGYKEDENVDGTKENDIRDRELAIECYKRKKRW